MVSMKKAEQKKTQRTGREYYEKYKRFTELGEEKGLTAAHKMRAVIKIMQKFFSCPQEFKIADLGGTYGSWLAFRKNFPESEIYSVNIAAEQVAGCEKKIVEDFSGGTSLKSGFFDVVFFGDTIEHLVEPDRIMGDIRRILKKGGFLIITTPNLASLANRFSLLFGFAPTNYHPSEIRHGTLFGAKQSSWHKSVFTVSAMKGFLKQHGFRPAVASGFNYRENFLLGFLPDNWKEGMIVFAERK